MNVFMWTLSEVLYSKHQSVQLYNIYSRPPERMWGWRNTASVTNDVSESLRSLIWEERGISNVLVCKYFYKGWRRAVNIVYLHPEDEGSLCGDQPITQPLNGQMWRERFLFLSPCTDKNDKMHCILVSWWSVCQWCCWCKISNTGLELTIAR